MHRKYLPWHQGHLVKQYYHRERKLFPNHVLQNCYRNNCGVSLTECDTKVYLTWRGTDKKGIVLISDNYRLSNFMDYSLNTLYASAKTLGNKFWSSVN